VERLLELFNQFSLLVKEAFNDDPRYLTARDKAYKQVVNDTQVFRLELPSKQVIYILCTAMHSPPKNIVEKWQ
jgi:cullin-5